MTARRATSWRLSGPAGSAAAGLIRALGTDELISAELVARTDADHADLGELLRRRLADVVAVLGDPAVRVVFGGHFSSGKSSLINMLIGRALLPTGDLPETGVPCELRAGDRAEAVALRSSGTVALPLETDAIAHEVSLIGADGDVRSRVRDVRRIVVTLDGSPLPPGASWIDSPGINDASKTGGVVIGERAVEVADEADVLVWVVNSRQAMSEVEQAFLRSYAGRRHPDQVVFLINAFLPSVSESGWAYFTEKIEPAARGRIAGLRLAEPWSPEIVAVSALAAAAHPGEYGGPAARRLLAELSDPGHTRVRRARLHRAATVLAEVAAAAQRRHTELTQAAALAEAERARAAKELAGQRKAFEAAVTSAVGASFARHRATVEACGAAVANEMVQGSLQRDGTYTRSLERRLAAAAEALARDAVSAVNGAAGRHHHSGLSAAAEAQLRTLLRPSAVVVTVPANPTKGVGAGAIIGGILGTLIAPGIGTAIGAAIGGGVGGSAGSSSAEAADLAGARASAIGAGGVAASALLGQQAAVVRLAVGTCAATGRLPAAPDTSRAASAQRLAEYLGKRAELCRSLAAAVSAGT